MKASKIIFFWKRCKHFMQGTLRKKMKMETNFIEFHTQFVVSRKKSILSSWMVFVFQCPYPLEHSSLVDCIISKVYIPPLLMREAKVCSICRPFRNFGLMSVFLDIACVVTRVWPESRHFHDPGRNGRLSSSSWLHLPSTYCSRPLWHSIVHHEWTKLGEKAGISRRAQTLKMCLQGRLWVEKKEPSQDDGVAMCRPRSSLAANNLNLLLLFCLNIFTRLEGSICPWTNLNT